MKNLNWGILGPGRIANTFATAGVKVDSANIIAVASRSVERAQGFANEFNIPKVYDDYGAMLADPELDIIYIATPHSFHYPQAKICLEAGKHVLLEKPVTINAGQMQELTALAKQKRLFLQEAIWSRFMPCLAEVKKRIEQGVIGDIQYIKSDIGFAFQHRAKGRLFDPMLGGGALLDLGLYSIALSQAILQEDPIDIQAMAKIGGTQVDETTLVNMQYASGRYSQFSCTATGFSRNEMTIVGSDGQIVLPAMFWDMDQAQLVDLEGKVESIDIPHSFNGFEYQIQEAARCIAAGKICSDYLPHQQSIGIMQVMDEIRRQVGLSFSCDIEAL